MSDFEKFVLDELKAVRLENVALQGISAALMYEIAKLHGDSAPAKLAELIDSLQGLALRIGEVADQPAYTKAINSVCRMAEVGIPAANPKKDPH